MHVDKDVEQLQVSYTARWVYWYKHAAEHFDISQNNLK